MKRSIYFEDLQHESQNLVLTAENTSAIRRSIDWLTECIAKRLSKDLPVTVEYLAGCSTMKSVLTATVKELRRCGFEMAINHSHRVEAARYLAETILDEF
jgi:hypothetical protein